MTEAAPFRVTTAGYGRGDPRMAMSSLAHRFSGRILAYFLSAILGFSAGSAFAQTYPVKPVRMIVPFTAGGTSDAIARAFAQKFSEAWKHQVLVESRPGAGTIIGAEVVAKAAPDGHTLLIAAPSHAILSSIYRKLPFDPV
ncbi:MAG: tripartite tricarboxylate transporter substrate-binding protein, partial [Sulfuricaulis sp.]|nr:tripartite tricarboxylate transporter substrate-binding protein [Sulfuricaulis sp.]